MRKLYFLVPGTTGKFYGGGLFAELKTLKLAQRLCEAAVVTYRQREQGVLFLDDLLQGEPLGADRHRPDGAIFVVGWGFDVPKLLKRLGDRPTIYHAHSVGYGFRIPPRIPILCVSRYTLGYWGERASTNLLYYLPNEISPEFENHGGDRDIDVLVQTRKSSHYLLNQLLPALESHCRVERLTGYVEDIASLFNRSKVYLYDSAEYWATSGVTEGFGLPPLEAIACGCQVFASVNHGLADFLDPGIQAHKLAGYATAYDLQRILAALHAPPPAEPSLLDPYRAEQLIPRLQRILAEINQFFDFQHTQPASDIPALTPYRLLQRRSLTVWQKIQQKIHKRLKNKVLGGNV